MINKLINKQSLYVIVPFAVFTGLFYFALPILSDDWTYSTTTAIKQIFSMNTSGIANPGRHIAMSLHIISDRFFGTMFGAMIGSPVWGLRIAHGLFGGIISFLFLALSKNYIIIKNKYDKFTSLILGLLALCLPIYLYVYNYYIMNIGSVVMAFFAWLPFLHYYKYQSLPKWMEEYSDYQVLGIYLVIFYCGTHIIDSVNYVFLGMSLMLAVYLVGSYIFTKKKESPLLYRLLALHICLGFFSMIRNVINVVFFSKWGAYRMGNMTFNIVTIIKRLIIGGGNEGGHPTTLFYHISFVIAAIIIIGYIYIYIRDKRQKIDRVDYYIFSTQVVGLVVILGLAILGTYYTAPLWILWITQVGIFVSLFEKKNKLVSLLLPIVVFSFMFSGMRTFHDGWFNRGTIVQRTDLKLVELFKQAEKDNAEQVALTKEQVESWRYNNHWSGAISRWMHHYGYTSKVIPIVIEDTE